MQELDCSSVLKTIRRLKLLSQVFFTRKQKLFLRFQKKNVLDSESSSTDSDEYGAFMMKLIDEGDVNAENKLGLLLESF